MNPFHILPTGDVREHQQSSTCWCAPTCDPELIIHNAADGREFFEEDEREALLAGLRDMAAGRVVPWEEVRRKLNYGKAV